MTLLERMVWALTGLAVLGVMGLVALPAFGVRTGSSPVTDQAVWYDFERMNPWLDAGWQQVTMPVLDERGRATTSVVPGRRQSEPLAPGPVSGGERDAGAGRRRGDGDGARVEAGSDHARGDRTAPFVGPDRADAPVVRLPRSLVEKYRYEADARRALSSAVSVDVDYDGEPAVLLEAVAPGSPLERFLGLQAGDVVVAVNGYPVSKADGLQLFRRLRDARAFRVEIVRGGGRFIVRYTVQ